MERKGEGRQKAESRVTLQPTSQRAFVLMPFDQSFNDVYQLGISEACKNTGWQCSRVDEHIFSGLILTKLYEEIASADIIIADMTGRNPNVFYEVGFCHALGKRVILLTRTVDDIPFDLRGHRHIVYNNSVTDLQRELVRELSSILAEQSHQDFNLGNLSVYALEASKNRVICSDNFISLRQGIPVLLRNAVSIQVPGEISNFGKGLFFDFALCIKNLSSMSLDLSETFWKISIPKEVSLADSALRLGHGKLIKLEGGPGLTLSGEYRGSALLQSKSRTLMFHFRSELAENGRFLNRVPFNITILRRSEWLSFEIFVEFAPLIRLN